MSLGVAIKGPEGVVLAADSRVTITAQGPGMEVPLHVNFDNASKLLSFTDPNGYVGAVTYGLALIGMRTAHSYVTEFEVELQKKAQGRLSVNEFAKHLSEFFVERWFKQGLEKYEGPGMMFLVGGYDADAPYGSVFFFEVPNNPKPEQRNEKDFGMTWGGQLEIASRIVFGYDPALIEIVEKALALTDQGQKAALREALKQLQFKIPYNVLPLQDCVDLATFLIRTTMSGLSLAIGVRGVGGKIEVATVTRNAGLKFVQKKEIHGELRP